MKKCTLIISIFVFACNSKEDQLGKQLSELEAQLPKAEKEYYQSMMKLDSVKRVLNDVSLIDSDLYKDAVSNVTDAKIKTNSIKQAIADTKEKIMLEK